MVIIKRKTLIDKKNIEAFRKELLRHRPIPFRFEFRDGLLALVEPERSHYRPYYIPGGTQVYLDKDWESQRDPEAAAFKSDVLITILWSRGKSGRTDVAVFEHVADGFTQLNRAKIKTGLVPKWVSAVINDRLYKFKVTVLRDDGFGDNWKVKEKLIND